MSCKINLIHRGPSVIKGFDLFDECHYGADDLFLRGHVSFPELVAEQVKIAIGEVDPDFAAIRKAHDLSSEVTDDEIRKMIGVGNPLTVTPEDGKIDDVPNIALNRYKIIEKKFWLNQIPNDIANPYKASNAVKFSIRVYFHNDFAYIDFGIPWSLVMDEKTDEIAKDISLAKTSNFTLLSNIMLSKEDSFRILEMIFPDVDIRGNYEKANKK